MDFTRKVNPFSSLEGTAFKTGAAQLPSGMQSLPAFNAPEKGSFKDVVSGLAGDLNATLGKPDELMHRSMTQGDVDIHEVMIANAKADIAVNVASQVVTKVIQAYERVQQIQV